MKIYRRIVNAGLVLLALTLVLGCGSTGSVSTAGNPSGFELPAGETAFYSDAMNTIPVIEATVSAASISAKGLSLKITTEWESGNPAYEIFNVLREYEYPRDEGVIDVSNIYKLLFEAGTQYSNAVDEINSAGDSEGDSDSEDASETKFAVSSELATPAVVASPFDFGNDPVTYTHASDHYALALDGDAVQALLTWIWDESPTMSYGVLEGSFNGTTGDITLDMAYLVDYEGEDDYSLRTFVSGNKISHQFTLKIAKCGHSSGVCSTSMIGTGISRSDNAEDYFLMKIIDGDNLSDFPEGRWFKVPASATEDDLMALSGTGSDLADIADPNNYAEAIEELTFFALDGSDNATSVTDFESSDLILVR